MVIIESRKHKYEYKPKGDHQKYRNSDGQYIPSVTTVIDVIPKKALIQWANNLGWKRKSVKAELNIAANIGTKAHNFAEKIIQKDKIDGVYEPDIDLQRCFNFLEDKRVYNCCKSFLAWYDENRKDIELIDIERVMQGESYGGTCDLICRYKGKLMIFDFKTSSGFYFSMFVQLAAYCRLYENETNEYIEDVAVLRFDKKNGTKAKIKFLSDVEGGDIDFYYKVFSNCLMLFMSLYVIENQWKLEEYNSDKED